MLVAMEKEIALQAHYLDDRAIESIYFGGGTPSLLEADEVSRLIDAVGGHFDIQSDAEITLEANPDDLNNAKVAAMRSTPVNRFSIGVQSFFEEDLRWMNRAHNAVEASGAIQRVQDHGYQNITADLIYGYPLLTDQKWSQNIERLLDFGVPHISAYCMTVEPQTALASFIRKGKQTPIDDGQGATQFELLMDELAAAGYEQYEISNFAKPEQYARHNSNYWKGVPYLGVGPSAHSFDGYSRQWNVRNNASYIRAIQNGVVPYEREELSEADRLNEYIMTALRTLWGLNLDYIDAQFNASYSGAVRAGLESLVIRGEVTLLGKVATLTKKGKLVADRVAAELFVD
jgi:putative oxygen-independent coproporphyrinogen III oxidase